MDRDKRWERTQLALDAIVDGKGEHDTDPLHAIQESYKAGVTDEFILPVVLEERPRLEPSRDTAISFNFRPDRMRQLAEKLAELETDLTTMTKYRDDFDFPVAFPEQSIDMVMAEVLAQHGLRQLHMAETEKYAHVTFFFNGGVEAPVAGEERILIPSPRVATYDLQPEMSCPELTDRLCAAIRTRRFDAIVCNIANPDMVGHTGVLSAAIKAAEAVDVALGAVRAALEEVGGEMILTADHGNLEQMRDRLTGQPHTAHTVGPVPCVYLGRPATLRDGGALRDLAPTLLELLGIAPPAAMTGRSLVQLK
jgi:2,3-bisphosphoglycerate-independent phosphoglycerate mutase